MIRIINNAGIPQLAFCKKGHTIVIRPYVTPEEFFSYFQGNGKGASNHKREVLARLDKLKWPLRRIQELLTTPAKVRRFLLLHEASHIRHRDNSIVRKISLETRTAIETRACLEALIQMAFEHAYSPNPTIQISCDQIIPHEETHALPF